MQTASQCWVIFAGQVAREIPLHDISELIQEPQLFLWIDVQPPSSELLALLGEELDLHELSTGDALTMHQRPKLEEYGAICFISG